MNAPEQFDFDGEKYSLVNTYPLQDFLLSFVAGKFRHTDAFLKISKDLDWPMAPVYHEQIKSNFWFLHDYCGDEDVAVYERLKLPNPPKKVCGNCKHFCRHYSGGDSPIELVLLDEGHCTGRRVLFNRVRNDAPKGDCFEWNAKCKGEMEYQNKGEKQK